MRSKWRINKYDGSYYDSDIEDTVKFNIQYNPSGNMEFPIDKGVTIWVTTFDSCGLRETLSGSTHYKHNGMKIVPREKELTVKELVKDLL